MKELLDEALAEFGNDSPEFSERQALANLNAEMLLGELPRAAALEQAHAKARVLAVQVAAKAVECSAIAYDIERALQFINLGEALVNYASTGTGPDELDLPWSLA